MLIGKLRHYCTIERKTATSVGDRGEPIYSWVPLYDDVPASIEALTGREVETARQLMPEATYKVNMRYHDINTQDRIVHGDMVLQIGHINNVDQRNRWQVLLCSEVG